MKRLKTLKGKKGFTLIEIIVVLVILAILAAITIPALIGFVDEARGKAYITEARAGIVAAQAVVTEVTAGTGTVPTTDSEILNHQTFKNMTADVGGVFSNVHVDTSYVSGTTGAALNRVDGITYKNGGYTIVIASGGATVTKP